MTSLTVQLFFFEDGRMQFNLEHHFVTRVGGNPESKLSFQTHIMSDLVNDEFNDADDS